MKPSLLRRSMNWVFGATRRDDPMRFIQMVPHSTAAGETITMDNALTLSVVWACIVALTNAVAGARWNIYTQKDETTRLQVFNDPLNYILNTRPNADMTAVGFRETQMFSLLTWGNSYAEIVRDGAGRIKELWPLLPHRVMPRREMLDSGKSGKMYYDYYEQDGGVTSLDASDMLHYRGPGITGLMGDNLISRMVKTLGLAAAQERFASTYFGNNTILGGFLEYPRTLDDKTFNHLRESWEDRFRGPAKSNKPAILENGMKWNPISNDANAAQMVESRHFTVEEICRWFGVPPHKVMHLLRSTFSNIEHQSIEFVRDGVTPWARRIEQESDFKLFSSRSTTVRYTLLDLAPLTQGDFKSRMEGYEIGRRSGVYSVNEIRAKEGENNIGPVGDIRIVEANMQTMDQLTSQKEPEIYQYHIQAGIPTVNEVRARLHLKPVPGGEKPANQIAPGQAAETHDHVEKPPPPAPPPGADEGAKEKPAEDVKPAVRKTKGGESVAKDAITVLIASAFERYDRRRAHRMADLSRTKKGRALDAKLAEDRAEHGAPRLFEEIVKAREIVTNMSGHVEPDETFLAALDEIDNGAPASEVAKALINRLMKEIP